jgi:hypothetical protein
MLNYTEKSQNTYIRGLTVWELMAIENCGLPSVPRNIAVRWDIIYVCSRERPAC